MFEIWYLPSILNAAQKLPKEVVYSAVAGLVLNEAHKRYMRTKLEEIHANAKARELELEVEKLRLQIDLRNAQIEGPKP